MITRHRNTAFDAAAILESMSVSAGVYYVAVDAAAVFKGMTIGTGVGTGVEYAAVDTETILECVAIVAGGMPKATHDTDRFPYTVYMALPTHGDCSAAVGAETVKEF